MKILQVIDTLDVGGAERIVVLLANLLHINNKSVSVIILVNDGDLIKELHPSISTLKLNRKKRFDFQKMKEFASIMDKFDVVHTHLKHNYRYTKLASMRYGKKKAKIILHDHSHNLLANRFTIKYYKDLLLKNIFKLEYYVGVSNENCAWGISYLGVRKEHCFLLENTIEKLDVIQKPSTKVGAVMVSNITPIKNIEFALDLVKEINEPLTIYGRIKDHGYYLKLKSIIKENELTEKVTFVTNCSNIQEELVKYKFAIHTSLKETGPLVLIEFLAQELPFVAFSSGQVFNTIGNVLPEFFIDTFNQANWIAKIKALSLVSSFKMKEIYEANFSTETYLQKCLNIYQKTIDS